MTQVMVSAALNQPNYLTSAVTSIMVVNGCTGNSKKYKNGALNRTSKPFVKGNADGPSYELTNAGVIIILFLAPLLVC